MRNFRFRGSFNNDDNAITNNDGISNYNAISNNDDNVVFTSKMRFHKMRVTFEMKYRSR